MLDTNHLLLYKIHAARIITRVAHIMLFQIPSLLSEHIINCALELWKSWKSILWATLIMTHSPIRTRPSDIYAQINLDDVKTKPLRLVRLQSVLVQRPYPLTSWYAQTSSQRNWCKQLHPDQQPQLSVCSTTSTSNSVVLGLKTCYHDPHPLFLSHLTRFCN